MLIRPAVADDRDALYDICLRTGDAGADATALYRDPELIGAIWAGPYLALEPDLSFVAVGDEGVTGYVLGAADTAAFEAACEQRWWPALRVRWPEPRAADATSADGRLIGQDPPPAGHAGDRPRRVPRPPAHQPAAEWAGPRCGWAVGGDAVRRAATARGVEGVHLGVGRRNERAIGFYEHLGFRPIADAVDASDALVMGISLR